MQYFSVDDAQACILQHTQRCRHESIALHDSLGRVLAEDVLSNRNHPPYDVSAMDGYGVRYADIAHATAEEPVNLAVVDDIRAGAMPKCRVLTGKAARIMTGAATPEGVDTVIRVEDTNADDDHQVWIRAAAPQGANIRLLGENLRKDNIVLTQGATITPGVLAILAMLKQHTVTVYAQPRVAILATGDELEALDEAMDEEKIPDANSHALYAQCKALGIEATMLGIARDNPIELRAKLAKGLSYDVLLASGGVSVGVHDFVRPTLADLGISMHFWRVAMRPGHPLAFGTHADGTKIFALPGNPVASMVCFEQFVTPALRAMMGHQQMYRRTVAARLTHDIKDRIGRTHFMRVTLTQDKHGYNATSTGVQGSGVLMSMAVAQALLPIPASTTMMHAGDVVNVQLLQGMEFQADAGVEC